MRKILLAVSLCTFLLPKLFAAQVMPTVITGEIENSIIDDETVLTGYCTLTHNLTIVPPHGKLTISRGAILEIKSPKSDSLSKDLLLFEFYEDFDIRAMNAINTKKIKLICRNENSLVFEDQDSTIIVNNIVLFLFFKKQELDIGTFKLNTNSCVMIKTKPAPRYTYLKNLEDPNKFVIGEKFKFNLEEAGNHFFSFIESHSYSFALLNVKYLEKQ
jgi:hypothetical protein